MEIMGRQTQLKFPIKKERTNKFVYVDRGDLEIQRKMITWWVDTV